MNHIEVIEQDTRVYSVQIAYSIIDSHGDKPDCYHEPDVWQIDIKATNSVEAIVNAKKILDIHRAEIMTDVFTGVMDPNGKYSLDDIKQVLQHAEHAGTFKSWLMMEPTSIQCTLLEDIQKLKDMTLSNLSNEISSVGDKAEDYLKEIDNDNA